MEQLARVAVELVLLVVFCTWWGRRVRARGERPCPRALPMVGIGIFAAWLIRQSSERR